jgi:outer membrane protein assembly factor BamE
LFCFENRGPAGLRGIQRDHQSSGKRPMRSLIFILPLLFSGCFLVPHKIAIQQGNYVDQQMVSKLKPEMTRSQVRFILGTPLIADPFHPDRWDYVYMTGKAGDVERERRLTVVFEEDRLVRIDGDIVAAEQVTQAPAPAAGR